MTEFNNGDRVRLTADHDGRGAGPEGSVIKCHDMSGSFLVKFDAPFDGHGVDGRCWYVPASKLALVGFKVQVGKTYQMRDGGTRGPMVAQEDFLTAGGMHYAENGECCYRGKSGDTVRPAEDLVAEWIEPAAAPAPAAEPVRYKVGDNVRMSDFATYFAGEDATISRVDLHDDVMPYLVTVGEDSMWVYAKDIVGPPSPAVAKVGDWVEDSEGDIGIVFHDDGDGSDNLHVGFIAHGGFDYYSAASLTVVPAGTTKAANDNAPILAEIDALQARIDGLRASIA